jgi:hypothetical protein
VIQLADGTVTYTPIVVRAKYIQQPNTPEDVQAQFTLGADATRWAMEQDFGVRLLGNVEVTVTNDVEQRTLRAWSVRQDSNGTITREEHVLDGDD